MAQYQRQYYSSSLYGRLNAFYGDYETDIFDAQEKFRSTVNANVTALLALSTYPATSPEFTRKGTWSVSGTQLISKTADSTLDFLGTGDDVEVSFRLQNTGPQTLEVKLFQEVQEGSGYIWVEKQAINHSTYSVVKPGEISKVKFNSFGYGNYKATIKVNETTGNAIVVSAGLVTNEVRLEVRASVDKKTWTAWEEVKLQKSLISGSQYRITGAGATIYQNVRYVQGKMTLLASDHRSSPVVERVELRSEDSGLYDRNGQYIVQIDMQKVAFQANKTFKKTSKIRWVQRIPNGTELNLRSSSSAGVTWSPITAPYRQNTKRLRLKKGFNSHSLVIGPINEGAKFLYSQSTEMLRWDTQAFLPKDSNDTSIVYTFSRTKNNQQDPVNRLMNPINNPMNVTNRKLSFNPVPYFLTVKLSRSDHRIKATPVVDMIEIYQNIQYKQVEHITDKDVSAVDNNHSGLKTLQKINDFAFSFPSVTNQIPFNQTEINKASSTYYLEDKTNRPSDIMVYLKSEEGMGTRTNQTTNAANQIIAKVKQRIIENGDKTGIISHYQYAAGVVQYMRDYERELDSIFTPTLLDTMKYRYYIKNGWPDEIHTAVQGQTLDDVAEMYDCTVNEIKSANKNVLLNEDGTIVRQTKIKIPNKSINKDVRMMFKNGTAYSQISSHNAIFDRSKGKTVTDLSSEKIDISVPVAPPKSYVDWVSEEKIYSGVINPGDVRGEFNRTQVNSSNHSDYIRDYTVAANDTWESISIAHDVYPFDLQLLNEDVILETGKVIKIPPNIVLPELAAEAEYEGENPYEITIIPDSVHKKTGQRIDESFIPIDWTAKHPPMKVTLRQSALMTVDVQRGADRGGMDPLPLSRVREVVSVKKKNGITIYHQYDSYLNSGSFKLTHNYIDWSPSQAGALEPEPGEWYEVTYRRDEVDTVEVFLDTEYFEQTGADLVWRSPEIKVFNGLCTPTQDFRMELPLPSQFQGYSDIYKYIDYVIEDNDLWVETKLVRENGKAYLIGTLNGKDPSKNWHPTINTGYYYLKEQEKYLYSEPIKTVLSEKELPTAKDIEYVNGTTGIGALLLPDGSNFVKDSGFRNVDWKVSKKFTITQ